MKKTTTKFPTTCACGAPARTKRGCDECLRIFTKFGGGGSRNRDQRIIVGRKPIDNYSGHMKEYEVDNGPICGGSLEVLNQWMSKIKT